MSKQAIYDELSDYMTNCGQDAGEWALADMAAELDADGISDIDDMDPDDFTDFLAKWNGKVTDVYGTPVDYAAAVAAMDDSLREELHAEGVETRQGFLELYAEAHAERFGEEFAPYYGHAW